MRVASYTLGCLLAVATNAAAFTPVQKSFQTPGTQLDATVGKMGARPIGIGSAAPKTVITNGDLEAVVETSDEWIRTRTGIGQRRVLLEGESLRALEVEAAKNALDMAGIKATDLDLVICATSSPDDLFGDAPFVASEIGCETSTVAFDLTAACSGFMFATVTASKFLSARNTGTKYALVVGADALSRFVDWDNRNVCILFGDAAGAMVMESCDENPGVLGYAARSNGKGTGELNCVMNTLPVHVSTPGDGTTLGDGHYKHMAMNGKEVYKFATREVPKIIEEALESAEMTVEDVDWLLLHQANIRIMEVVASRLGIPMEKVITNLVDYGNTSAASIPLAFDEAVRTGKVKKGDVIACAGFGAGLSWGSTIFKWQGEHKN